MMSSLRTVLMTQRSYGNSASTCTVLGSRRGRMMIFLQASQFRCPSVQQCISVVAVLCSWRSLTSTASSSTSSWTTRSIVSVISELSSVYQFTTNWIPTHGLTNSETCLASTTTTTLVTFGRNLNLLSKVRLFCCAITSPTIQYKYMSTYCTYTSYHWSAMSALTLLIEHKNGIPSVKRHSNKVFLEIFDGWAPV